LPREPGAKLDEGSILVAVSKRIEQRLRKIPEIEDVVIKIGRPDFATEAMGINESDTWRERRRRDQ
jgi:cobalt-zinc-cadmium resistance protein CzcA